jgi:hypothetical protein
MASRPHVSLIFKSGWWFGTFFIGNVIIPTDYEFSEG